MMMVNEMEWVSWDVVVVWEIGVCVWVRWEWMRVGMISGEEGIVMK